jgi:hypothetical protein
MQGQQTAPKRSLAPSQQPSPCRGNLAFGPKGQTGRGRAPSLPGQGVRLPPKPIGYIGHLPTHRGPELGPPGFSLEPSALAWVVPSGQAQGWTIRRQRDRGNQCRKPWADAGDPQGHPWGSESSKKARFDRSGSPRPRPCIDHCKPARASSTMATKRSRRPREALDWRGHGGPCFMGPRRWLDRYAWPRWLRDPG